MTMTWELTLQRMTWSAGRRGDPRAEQGPGRPDDANSWLTFDDPLGRFHFRHPQDMHPQNDPLLRVRRTSSCSSTTGAGATEGRVLTITLQPKTGKAEEDRKSRDPEFHKKDLNDNWARNRRDVLHGPAGWLPEADWAPYKMKVYRIEAAEKPSGTAARDVPRIFLDRYLVLFSRNESLVVDAMTGQDPPVAFRKQVEEILKTFALSSPRTARPRGVAGRAKTVE